MSTERNENCACSNTGCPRHGNCKECQAFHASRGDLPCCKR